MPQPKMMECNDCGAKWSETNATNCLGCNSKNIFIYWEPGKYKAEPEPKKQKPKKPKKKFNIIDGF